MYQITYYCEREFPDNNNIVFESITRPSHFIAHVRSHQICPFTRETCSARRTVTIYFSRVSVLVGREYNIMSNISYSAALRCGADSVRCGWTRYARRTASGRRRATSAAPPPPPVARWASAGRGAPPRPRPDWSAVSGNQYPSTAARWQRGLGTTAILKPI